MIAIHIYFTLFKELFLDLYSLTCAATMNKINLHLIEKKPRLIICYERSDLDSTLHSRVGLLNSRTTFLLGYVV